VLQCVVACCSVFVLTSSSTLGDDIGICTVALLGVRRVEPRVVVGVGRPMPNTAEAAPLPKPSFSIECVWILLLLLSDNNSSCGHVAGVGGDVAVAGILVRQFESRAAVSASLALTITSFSV